MADKGDNARTMPALDPDVLARAECAVSALGDSFVEKLKSDIAEIRTIAIALAGSQSPSNNASIETVYTFAHDMRGQGGSFGYPLLSEIGGSLSDFLEKCGNTLGQRDILVLQAHLDAAAAVISNKMSGSGDSTARALIDSLETLAQKHLTGQC